MAVIGQKRTLALNETEASMLRKICLTLVGGLLATTATFAQDGVQTQARDDWLVVESEGSKKSFIAKVLNRAPTAKERTAMTRLLRVTWNYESTVSGLPLEQDLQHIARIEDHLSEALSEGRQSKLVMSETGEDGRLWLFYVSDGVDIQEAIRLVSSQQRARLTLSIVHDPAWNHLRDVQGRVKRK